MKKIIVLALIVISTTAFAQQEKGDLNVTFSGTYMSYSGFNFGQVYGKAGYYITKSIEVGAKPQLLFGKGFTGFGFGGYGTYNFLTADAKLVPYAGAELSYFTVASLSQTNLGIYGGSKYFLTERLNVDAGLNLAFNLANNSDVNLGTIFQFQVGVGFILGNLNKKE
jgi:hypothetical protein